MQVYLIRHTSVAVSEPTCYGRTDIDVNTTFPEEAAKTKALLDGITFDKVYCSPLCRASKLAAYCGYPDAERDDRLQEMWMGDWELKPFHEIPTKDIQEWYEHYMELQMLGGESTHDVYLRIQSFFSELKEQPYKRVAVFYHGCAILCTRIWCGQLPQSAGFNDFTEYGGIEVITI